MAAAFSSVPILDYELLYTPSNKSQFLAELQHAVVNVGFLYLKNPPVSPSIISELLGYIPRLFDLPQEAKENILMANSPHFLGYSRLGAELTKGQTDIREQFDFAGPRQNKWKDGDPEYLRLWGPAQWPDENLIPGFRQVMTTYIHEVEAASLSLIGLLAEALGLQAKDLLQFYEDGDGLQHRAKIVKYPSPTKEGPGSNQGVGPHYDGGFLTFLLQATSHRGLQVQNLAGEWIDVPPVPNTFVVNIGKALEFVTDGLARATSHRVVSPPAGSEPRYSVPFFQNISLHAKLSDKALQFPAEILKLKEARGDLPPTESVNFSEFDRETYGQVNLIGRVKSHPDVAQRHYPELFAKYFPQGLPAQGSAY